MHAWLTLDNHVPLDGPTLYVVFCTEKTYCLLSLYGFGFFFLLLGLVLLCETTELKGEGCINSQHVSKEPLLLSEEQRFNNESHPSNLMMKLWFVVFVVFVSFCFVFIQKKCLFFKIWNCKTCFHAYSKKLEVDVLTIIFNK